MKMQETKRLLMCLGFMLLGFGAGYLLGALLRAAVGVVW